MFFDILRMIGFFRLFVHSFRIIHHLLRTCLLAPLGSNALWIAGNQFAASLHCFCRADVATEPNAAIQIAKSSLHVFKNPFLGRHDQFKVFSWRDYRLLKRLFESHQNWHYGYEG
jgi:hypothetical protein